MARLTLAELIARSPKADQSKVAALTEEQIRQCAIEDGDDPDEDVTGYVRTDALSLEPSSSMGGRAVVANHAPAPAEPVEDR